MENPVKAQIKVKEIMGGEWTLLRLRIQKKRVRSPVTMNEKEKLMI